MEGGSQFGIFGCQLWILDKAPEKTRRVEKHRQNVCQTSNPNARLCNTKKHREIEKEQLLSEEHCSKIHELQISIHMPPPHKSKLEGFQLFEAERVVALSKCSLENSITLWAEVSCSVVFVGETLVKRKKMQQYIFELILFASTLGKVPFVHCLA